MMDIRKSSEIYSGSPDDNARSWSAVTGNILVTGGLSKFYKSVLTFYAIYNKMLPSTLKFNDKTLKVSFFEDDNIGVVRQQIGRTLDIHPDRLFIMIQLKFDKDYYRSDSRNWEMLFDRISLNGHETVKESFYAYCKSRGIEGIKFKKLNRSEWMAKPSFLQPLFDPGVSIEELRIFGVEVSKAYALPYDPFDMPTANMIPSAQQPIPDDDMLFVSHYPDVTNSRFVVKEFEEGYEGPYFPLKRSSTPQRLSESQIASLEASSRHLEDLLGLDPPQPKDVHILRMTWRAELVDTDFGESVRSRFEQMFYALTLSEQIPCITFFTGRSEVSRHKFYKKDERTKLPLLDLAIWNNWWTKTKPYRDRIPTLVLYKGDSRENFDRITMTKYDIIIASYRDSNNTTSEEEIKEDLIKWFKTLDSITPFVKQCDITKSRFVLQDVKLNIEYSDSLDSFDTLRMGCLAGIFEVSRKSQQVFKFLRSDNANNGINPRDVKILNILKDDPFITPEDIKDELHLSLEDTTILLDTIKQKVEQEPSLLTRQFRNFPSLIIHRKSIEISDVDSVGRFLKYANILRYILSDPKNDDVNRVCPKKQESAPVEVSTVNTEIIDTEFSNMFDYLEGDVIEKEEPSVAKTKTFKRDVPIYNYFNNRLQSFNPETLPIKSDYASKVDQKLQPVIMTQEEIQAIIDEQFSPANYPAEKKIELKNPDGVIVCPDFWCMVDKIPLHESQLEEMDGTKVCPVCHGKVRKQGDNKSGFDEFPVIQRTIGNNYPGYKENDPSLPICFKSVRKKKLDTEAKEDKYYILGETKTLQYNRLAYVPLELLNMLHLEESYKLVIEAGNRIQAGMSGYFRVGLGRPSEGLPMFLNLSSKIESPRFAIKKLLRCSFVALWTELSDTYSEEIERELDMKPFSDDPKASKHMSKVISGIDEAFTAGKLTILQELEYTAIMLKTDFYRINLNDLTIGCTFFTPQIKSRTRGIIILQRGTEVDCLCHVTRQQKKFIFRANIFEIPFIRKDESIPENKTYLELTKKRNLACVTEIPNIQDAFNAAHDLNIDSFSLILDPFRRAQAIYVPDKLLLPFQNTAFPPLSSKPGIISGYSSELDLPSYEDTKDILKKVEEETPGYAWAEDMYDGKDYIVEILTRSGLRIPVKPKKGQGEASEVTHTIIQESESSLALEEPNKQDLSRYKKITYESEVYEFLLYQLTLDIKNRTNPDLVSAISEQPPKTSELEPELRKWFDEVTHFVSLDTPIEFLSKIRKPCGQFKKDQCNNSHMCAWNGNTCRIQVRNSISKQKLFNKLLGVLLDNSKIRSVVLDGRTTPFFSTVLYLQLPNEIIYTDSEIKELRGETV